MTAELQDTNLPPNGWWETGINKDRFDAITSAMGAHALLIQSSLLGLDEKARATASANFNKNINELSEDRLRSFSKGVFIALYGESDTADKAMYEIDSESATEEVLLLETRPWKSIHDRTRNIKRLSKHSSMFEGLLERYLDEQEIETIKQWDAPRRGKFMDALYSEILRQYPSDMLSDIKAREAAELYLPRLELVYEKVRSEDIGQIVSLKTRAGISATLRLHLPKLLDGREVKAAYALISSANESAFVDTSEDEKEREESTSGATDNSPLGGSENEHVQDDTVDTPTEDGEIYYDSDSHNMYWKSIKKIRRLSDAETVELGKQIEAGVFAEYKLENNECVEGYDISDLKVIAEQGKKAKSRLVEANLRLVAWMARRYGDNAAQVSQQDLIQEGNIALWRAMEEHDYKMGKFGGFAGAVVDKAMLNTLRNHGRSVRLPSDVVTVTRKLRQANDDLAQQFGRAPSVKELADAIESTEEKVIMLLPHMMPVQSLDAPAGPDTDISVGEFIEDPAVNSIERSTVHDVSLRTKIERVLGGLTSNERKIIRLRFGLDDGWSRGVEEVAEQLGVSRRAVRNAESSAFAKMRSEENVQLLMSKSIASPTLADLGIPKFKEHPVIDEEIKASQTAYTLFRNHMIGSELLRFAHLPQEIKNHFAGELLGLHEQEFPNLKRAKVEETIDWVMATLEGESAYDIAKRLNIRVGTVYKAIAKDRFEQTLQRNTKAIDDLVATIFNYSAQQVEVRQRQIKLIRTNSYE